MDVPPEGDEELPLERVAGGRRALDGHGRAARRFEPRHDLGPGVAERLQIRGIERVDQPADELEPLAVGRDLRRPLVHRLRDRPRVPCDAGRVSQTLRRIALLAIGDRLGLEGDTEMVADAAKVGLRVAHEVLVAHVDERDGSLAKQTGEGGDVPRQDGVVVHRDLIVAVEEGLDVRGEHRERVASEHDVVGARVELRQEGEDERVCRRLVEEEALARPESEQTGVEGVGVGAERVEIVRLSAGQVGDDLLDRLLGVERVVGRPLHAPVVAEVGDRGDEVRLGTLVDL